MNKVSIITVTFNSGKNLENCIKSVIAQTYKNIEYLIIDGGSTDDTINIVKKYKKKIDFFISEKDCGIWDAMNKGLKNATGDIVCFLNSDDVFYNNAIKMAVKYFKNQQIDFLFGSVKKYKLMQGYRPWMVKFSFGFYTSHSVGFFIRTKKHKEIGYYNKKYLSADLDFFYRMIMKFKARGVCTTRTEVMGKFAKHGFSSKINYIDHLYDLNQIRIDNCQNRIFVYLLFIVKILKKPIKFLNSIKK